MIDGLYLTQVQIGAKSESYDLETGHHMINNEPLILVNWLRPYFKKALSYPTWITNIIYQSTSKLNDKGHTQGAKGWVESGNKLIQAGVTNQEYYPYDPTENM